jgi:hypothetical protein
LQEANGGKSQKTAFFMRFTCPYVMYCKKAGHSARGCLKILLKRMIKNWAIEFSLDRSISAEDLIGGSFEYGNKTSGCIKTGKFVV